MILSTFFFFAFAIRNNSINCFYNELIYFSNKKKGDVDELSRNLSFFNQRKMKQRNY